MRYRIWILMALATCAGCASSDKSVRESGSREAADPRQNSPECIAAREELESHLRNFASLFNAVEDDQTFALEKVSPVTMHEGQPRYTATAVLRQTNKVRRTSFLATVPMSCTNGKWRAGPVTINDGWIAGRYMAVSGMLSPQEERTRDLINKHIELVIESTQK